MTLDLLTQQSSFPGLCPVTEAVEALSSGGSVDERGAIFTRREVVDFILDLSGYTPDKPLHALRLLEPSFGGGDFLLPAVDRLLLAWQASKHEPDPLTALRDSIRAVELHRATFDRTRTALLLQLQAYNLPRKTALSLADQWLIQGDFLLVPLPSQFDVVVGNPPYVRQELIPEALMAEYRRRYTTVYDRADLYIPFIERSLRSLAKGGCAGFICADRWMKNRYGGPLRALIAEQFHLKAHVDMTNTQPFHTEVAAYPAISVIGQGQCNTTRVAHGPEIDSKVLARLALEITGAHAPHNKLGVRELVGIASNSEPWILGASEQTALVRRLERCFPTLEEAACKVGIGVATGADKSFIGNYEELDVESSRKLPLATTRDIASGTVDWKGQGVVNPFSESGGLVPLNEFPRLKRYLESRKPDIAARHCAQKSPANWYRTIDRITPSLAHRPKLLIPDIKGDAQVVYESGQLYPHHNLYYITSDEWDLHALQAVLLSGIARLFVATYSTRMRGGYLRFQAQYLRRIRVPFWKDLDEPTRQALIEAGKRGDTAACNAVSCALYGLSDGETAVLESAGG